MVEQFFLVIRKPLHKYYLLEWNIIILTSSHNPFMSKNSNKINIHKTAIIYKSYRFCESPAFSMFRELTIKIKLLRQYGKKTWDSIIVMVAQFFLVIHKPS